MTTKVWTGAAGTTDTNDERNWRPAHSQRPAAEKCDYCDAPAYWRVVVAHLDIKRLSCKAHQDALSDDFYHDLLLKGDGQIYQPTRIGASAG